DLVVYEKLQVKNMVKNHHLAKRISDAGWSQFTTGLEYFAKVFKRTVVAVAPQYTSQGCSSCGVIVKKSLSTRTHTCSCGCVLDRDINAALNILVKGRSTVGHRSSNAWVEAIGLRDRRPYRYASGGNSRGPVPDP
uniref:RNA-guided endonuclease InsQ/TnpB family protein n=1 Tax=Candidatus Cyanaurora vandensis TaxID=2714958 RepID=UPI0037BF0366